MRGNQNAKGCTHSDEAKAKMSLAKKGMSDETRAKMSLAKKGQNNPLYNQKLSDETKEKMSLAKKGCPRPKGAGRTSVAIEVFDLETQIKTIYPSICAAAQALGVRDSSIVNYFKRNTLKPFKGRYKLKKVMI